MQRALATA